MSQGTTARDRQARSAAYTAFAVQGLCFASLVTQVPQMQKAHHLSDATLSLVLLMVPLIAGVGSVASGALFQRFGSGPVLRVSQPAVAVTIALIGLTGDNDVALYVAVAAFGLFVGAVDASMNAQAIAVERRYGVSLITGFYAVWSVAGILGGCGRPSPTSSTCRCSPASRSPPPWASPPRSPPVPASTAAPRRGTGRPPRS
ncbi:MFS transporter [Actinomadura madurae]|uniref:MFS transporter n=1 Tax=Actinomadura madurae TaxID=1993 RepID=UPI00355905A6